MATTTNVDIEAVPAGERAVGAQVAEAQPREHASTRVDASAALRHMWEARGFFGGLLAIAIAIWAQYTLINTVDGTESFRLYALAVVVLLLSLWRPDFRWLRRLSRRRTTSDSSRITNGHIGEAGTVALAHAHAAAAPEGATGPLIARRAVRARQARQSAAAPNAAPYRRPWVWYFGWRERVGWRATAPGYAISAALAVAAGLVLQSDPFRQSSPLGGWLWFAALVTLFLTSLGAPAWPRGHGLLPGPTSDFFARGLPQLPASVEGLVVGVIMLVALALRMIDLEYMPGIFGDEGERGMDARGIINGSGVDIFADGWWSVPNLYFYAMTPFIRLFGDTMVGARMLSVVSGLVAVWFVYKTGRLLWGQRAGLIAGALMAVSPLALQFSRQAGESTPTAALWAIGFYFFFLGLRYRRPSDWMLSGVAWGLSLYFYASGKLIIPLIAAVGLYCLVRWHINFFKRYALLFGLLLAAFLLTFMPYAIFSAKENWQGFVGRASETSIFSPFRQAEAFNKYGIPYTPPRPGESLPSQVLSNPGQWFELVFEQTRVTTEVLYRNGDPTVFFQIRENGGALLAPLWAALAILGIVYGLWRGWDARFGLASIWFWAGLMGTALTMDTPSVQRLAGAWPALMLFPAALLDRIFAAGWPLSRSLARRWAWVPVAGLLLFFAAESYRIYFDHYRATCPFCDATTRARYAQALGDSYKAYHFGVGSYDVFFTYGSTRYIAKGVEGADAVVPADLLPVTDASKGVAFMIMPTNRDYMSVVQAFYPQGQEEIVRDPSGAEQFRAYRVTRDQLAATRTVMGTITLPDGTLLKRELPAFGVVDDASMRWARERGAAWPTRVSWKAGLVAPAYGAYVLEVKGGVDASLKIDGREMIVGAGSAEIVLAKGLHEVELTATLAEGAQADLLWASLGTTPGPIPPHFIYNGFTGGLSGEYVPLSSPDAVTAPDPLGEGPRVLRRNDTFFGFKEATNSVGQSPFIARYRGWLEVPRDGTYTLSIVSNGPSALYLDGDLLIHNISNGNIGGASGQRELRAGRHPIDLRYAWMNGRATFEIYWTPPGGENAMLPPNVLRPLEGSWLRSEMTGAPAAQLPQSAQLSVNKEPVAIMGGLQNPRGIAVDAEGNVYVADRGNGRVAVFGRDGSLVRSWGKAAQAGVTEPPVGEFVDLSDVAVGPDGTVYVMDLGANRLYLYTREGALKTSLDGGMLGTAVPNGIAVASNGDLFIASTAQSRVVVYANPSGLTEETKGNFVGSARIISGGSGPTNLEQPLDIVIDPANSSRAYIADVRDRIALIGADDVVTREWHLPTGRNDGVSRLAISPDGKTLYLSDPDRNRVAVIDVGTGAILYFGERGSGNGQFVSPSGIAVGTDGRIYVLDHGNGRVQVFAP